MDKKEPAPLRMIQRVFPVLEAVLPPVARWWGARLFITPFNMPLSETGKRFMEEAEPFSISALDRTIQCYRMGEGPAVIAVHGWSGKGAQFYHLGRAIAAKGLQLVTYDAPGHGKTPGKFPNMLEFAEVLKTLIHHTPDVKAVMGHSLGAAAISYAIAQDMRVPCMVSLGAPSIADDILLEYCKKINASAMIADAIREKCLREFGVPFDSFSMESTFQSVSCPVLAVHGDQDMDAGIQHLHKLMEINPGMETYVAKGLGHRRILKDPAVIDKVLEFILRK